MTPVLVPRKPLRITISGRKFSGAGLAGILERKSYTKQLVPFIAPVPWSWIAPTPSQSSLKIVEMTTSEICAAEFADWTIFDADFGDDDFLGECMRLFNVWLWCAEEDAPWDAWFSWKEMNYTERDMITAYGPMDTERDLVTANKITTSSDSTDDDEFAPRTAFGNWNMSDTMATFGPAFDNWAPTTDTLSDLVTANQMTMSDRRRFAEWMAAASNDSSTSLSSLCSTWSCLTTNWVPFACRCDEELEEGMRLFAAWSTEAEAEDDEEEVLVEPESHDIPWTVALLPTKDLLPVPSAGLLRALSCPDALMDSLAVLLFETRHFNVLNPRFGPSVLNTGNWLNAGFLNPGSALLTLPAPALNAGSSLLALPAPPAWMLALEHDRETDAPNSVSTVSLPSAWDAVSARLSSSSIFNLFSTSTSSASSLFADPTGVPSLDSTVAPWETPSTVSVTGSSYTSSASSAYPAGAPSLRSPTASLYTTNEESSIVSIPSNFFVAPSASSTTSASSVATDESSSFSEHVCHTSCFDGTSGASSVADVTDASASASSLFPDPTSAHSCSASCFQVAPSTASASSIFPDPRSAHSCSSSCFELSSSSSATSASSTTSASSDSPSICSNCGVHHSEDEDDHQSSVSSSAPSICPDCGVRHDEEETDEEASASSASDSTSSTSSSSNPYRHVRFGNYTLIPSTSATSFPSTSSSGYESDADAEEAASDTDFEGLTSEYEGNDVDDEEPTSRLPRGCSAYAIIYPVEAVPAHRSPSSYCFDNEPVEPVEEVPEVVDPVTAVSAATQTQAPDEEVCGLDKYLELFDEVHEMRRKLMETMGSEEEQAAPAPAPALEPEQTYNHEEAAIISRMAIAWDALLEDTSRLLKKAFEEKRRKIRFLM